MELEKCKECNIKKLYGHKIVCATCKDNERRMQLLREYDTDMQRLKDEGWLLK